jgi:hypothetical protein
MITIKRIEELAAHRLAPAWVIKLVQDCVEDEAQKYLQLESDFAGKFDATKENVFVAIKAIATGSYEA